MSVSRYSTSDPDRLRRYLGSLNFYKPGAIAKIMATVQGMYTGQDPKPYEDTFIRVSLEGDKWKVIEK